MTSSPRGTTVSPGSSGGSRVYTFHVGAVLGPEWVDWFGGGEIRDEKDGTARIIVEVRDQAMLFGLLIRIRDLGVPLLGLYPVEERVRIDPLSECELTG